MLDLNTDDFKLLKKLNYPEMYMKKARILLKGTYYAHFQVHSFISG